MDIPLKQYLEDEQYFPDANVLLCPVCDFQYTSFGKPKIEKGNDNYDADWQGRGDLLVIPFKTECGHKFDVCFGFHKGVTAVFTRPK